MTAQTTQFQVLASLGTPPLNPGTPLLQASDGKLYGTAPNGGVSNSGAIFRIDTTGTLETLFSFTPPYHPEAGLIQAADGQFYGSAVTVPNGSSQYFKIDATGTLTVLHTSTVAEGSYPSGVLLQASDGNFYGTTQFGGANNDGAIFRMDSSGNLTVLHNFSSADGANPHSGLIQASDGMLYGTTQNGGASDLGTVFKVDTSGIMTSLHSFTGADGANPSAGLFQASDGNFYGTTSAGGAAGLGSIFKMDPSGNVTILHSFAGSDGQAPLAALYQASDGNIYGTTSAGGRNGDGTIFRLDVTGNLTTIHDFAWTDGTLPTAAVTQASDGRLYGSAAGGGRSSGGTVFSTDLNGNVSVLYRFTDGPSGQNPFAGLVQAADGFFYGTASFGGANGLGTVFRINLLGQAATLHSFAWAEGANPTAPPIQATDGYFYGGTTEGALSPCPGGCGSIYRMDTAGNFTVLHLFRGAQYHDGAKSYGALLQATDGMFYGTTTEGGDADDGTVFRIDSSGNLTTLHSFHNTDGWSPFDRLFQANNGMFYGTTEGGGTQFNCGGGGCGTVFQIDSSGNLGTLHSFAGGADGWFPFAGLIQGPDGLFYGTTSGALGTIFKISSVTGSVTTLHTFNSYDGGDPRGTLLQASDGEFYGTTSITSSEFGNVFKLDTAGTLTVLQDFSGPNGARPWAGVIQGSDGRLYGTTPDGGSNGQGVIFSILPPGVLSVSGISPACGPATGGTTSTITGTFPDSNVTASVGNAQAAVVATTPTTIEITLPPGAAAQVPDVTVLDGNNGASVKLLRGYLYDFVDVPSGNPFHDFVCAVVRNGLSAGCGAGNFCPANPVLRSQMAVFLLTGEHGSVYLAPSADCATYPFTDVPCPSVFANYILQLYSEGITGGCATNPLRFCPSDPVSRADMAVFLLMAEHGTGYTPPACTGIFADVPCPGPFTNWIEALYSEGVTAGCSTNPPTYCPQNPVTRAQMAVFLSATFTLQ